MRVALLVAELGRSGGMGVIRDWARALDDAVPVRPLATMADEPVDVAVATWWPTAEALWDLRAQRHVVLLQSLDQRYYHDDEPADRLGAAAVLDLPVGFVAVSSHLARAVSALRPEASVHHVAPGIDKAVFAPVAPRSGPGPLRVLVEGQPSLWFKGVADAVAAVRRMREPATVTVVAADPSAAGEVGADRVCGGLAPDAMAALYAEHDVLLKLSRFEGLGLPVLEAFHVGRPAVLTPVGGADGIARHGVNALVVGFDDEPGTTDALDRLARDAALRERLGRGARATAAGWPSREDGAAAFGAVLRALAERGAARPRRRAPAARARTPADGRGGSRRGVAPPRRGGRGGVVEGRLAAGRRAQRGVRPLVARAARPHRRAPAPAGVPGGGGAQAARAARAAGVRLEQAPARLAWRGRRP